MSTASDSTGRARSSSAWRAAVSTRSRSSSREASGTHSPGRRLWPGAPPLIGSRTATSAASDDADIIAEARTSEGGGNMLIWAYHDPIPGYAYDVMIWASLIVGFIDGWLEYRRNRRG